jgi:hypothetical protein
MAANDYAQYLMKGNPDLVAKMAAIDPNWVTRDINGISDLTTKASADMQFTQSQAEQNLWQAQGNAPAPQVDYWANSQLGVTPQAQAAPGTGMYASYTPYAGAPEVKLVQDANGNWSNANAAAMLSYVNNGILSQQQKDALANQPKAAPADPNAPQLKLVQDAQGNWYNANAAATQEYAAQQIVKEAPKADPTSEFWKIANGTNPQVTDVPSTTNANDQSLIGQYHADQLAKFSQDAQGNWYNPNSTAKASSNPNQSAIDQWLAAHPNGPQTDADYAAFNKVNDPSYQDPYYTPGSFTPQSPGTIKTPYEDFQKYYSAMQGGNGSWGGDAHAESAATNAAVQNLAGYLKDPKAFGYTADQLNPMLSMLQESVQYSPSTTVDQYHAAQNNYYDALKNAFGFDFAGSVAKTGSSKGALSELASYLANPANLKNINSGALSQLASKAVQGANTHIGRAMQGDLTYMKTHGLQQYMANNGITDPQTAIDQQMNNYLNSFGSTMPT